MKNDATPPNAGTDEAAATEAWIKRHSGNDKHEGLGFYTRLQQCFDTLNLTTLRSDGTRLLGTSSAAEPPFEISRASYPVSAFYDADVQTLRADLDRAEAEHHLSDAAIGPGNTCLLAILGRPAHTKRD